MQQAQDFLDESAALFELVRGLNDGELEQATAFKGWTIEDVIGHLHVWNHAAMLSLTDESGFHDFFAMVSSHVKAGSLNSFERDHLRDLRGKDRVTAWWQGCAALAQAFSVEDPSARVVWAGPSMSVRSSATARLMETWAHGQEVYDLLGVVRHNHDRVRNIVVLGVNTFGWTFKVNNFGVPDIMPHLVLTAPSGPVWHYGDESQKERIEGDAVEFCQVVTQTRNIADTQLVVTGEVATRWMALAQCFAGKAETPPAVGTRITAGL